MLALITLIITLFYLNLASAEEVGKVTSLQGFVDILREGKPPAITVKINDPVYLNDIIRTKSDSKAEITFKDGTVVKVAPRSRIDISEYFLDAKTFRVTINLPRGKVGANLSKESIEKIRASPKANKFEIKTPIVVAGVRGTNYIVSHYMTYSTVTVITGRVYCYNPQFSDRVVDVLGGQSTVIREGAPPSPPRRLTPSDIQREQRDITPSMAEESEKGIVDSTIISGIYEEKPLFLDAYRAYEGETMYQPFRETTPPITETTQVTEPLNIDVSLLSIEPDSINLNYKVSANRNINVQYRIKHNGSYGNWTVVNALPQNPVYFSIPVLSGGSYQIEMKATDSFGNTKEWSSSTINPKLNNLSGTIKIDNSPNFTINGSVAGAFGIDKGVAKFTVLSSISSSSTFKAGGGNSSEGYWILKGPASSSYFRLLTPSYLFKGFGNSNLSSSTTQAGEWPIVVTSLTTEPWIELKELTLSAKFTGYDHYYDGTKINEVPQAQPHTILIGRTGPIVLPSNIDQTVTYERENYGIGYISEVQQSVTMGWGNFHNNSGSSLKLKGYAGGIGEDIYQNYALYGLYIGSDGSAGLFIGYPYGANQILHRDINILDIEPAFTLKKKTTGYSTMNTWSDYIQGNYQGYFIGGSGNNTISRKDINTTSYGIIGSATLSLKKGNNPEPWGVFGIELGGSHNAVSPTGLKLEFGGDNWDNRDASIETPDYWIGSISNATVSSGEILGNFQGKFMTPNHYGKIEGKMLGTLGSNKWVGVVIGSYEPLIELSHLSEIVSNSNISKIYKQNFLPTGARINAYVGGDSFWSQGQGSIYSIGKIDNYNEIDFSSGTPYLWYSPINWSSGSLRYFGYIGGRFGQKTDLSYNLSAYVSGIYNDSTNKGVFLGNLSTDAASNVLTLEKRFFLEGENTVKAVTLGTGSIPTTPTSSIISNISIDTNLYGITIQNQESYIVMDTNTNNYTFGAGIIGMGGIYNTEPTGLWEITYTGSFEGTPQTFNALIKGDLWGNENSIQKVIHGKTYGSFSDITGTPFLTGIFVGETVGTFDPTNKHWQSLTLGVAMETTKFLSMACPGGVCNKTGTNFTEEQEKLRKLGIPVVEVGKASFYGSGNNLTVNLNNVVFFSTQTGQKPLLWSTANVSGSYTGTPNLNQAITLNATSGASGSVNFTPTYWSNGNWAATIANDTAYPIQLSGGSYNGSINMKGLASGTYGSGNFSGTASGIVK
ncbi:MAG: FecR family protein [Thermodesulfovibrio sp.]